MLVLALAASGVKADIVDNFNRPATSVTIEQPDALLQRLKAAESNPEQAAEDGEGEDAEKEEQPVLRSKGKIVGYRVQIYADNNVRLAKGEARQRERAIARRFPSLGTYVAYVSPYWRLRVGDFRSEAEAQKVAADIRKAFPAYAREIRVVRDRINSK